MRAGDEQPSAALCVCAKRAGVHAGAQRHRQGAHGPAAAPAPEERHPLNAAVLQRVSEQLWVPSDVLLKTLRTPKGGYAFCLHALVWLPEV